jgi:Ni/Co efflux regulator RcnB
MKRFGKIQALALVAAVSAVTLAAPSTQAQTWGSQRREDRQERREDRQERREERREDRQERREERREERRGRNWGRYGQYGGSFQLRQTALNAGYNNGIQEGRRDRQRGERFNYADESDYRNATEDYSSRLGNRALYQRYFREGFANGYEDGYRGY